MTDGRSAVVGRSAVIGAAPSGASRLVRLIVVPGGAGLLLGGLLLGVVEVYAATLTTSNWEDVAAFTVLVVVLLFRPTGLLGESLGRARA